MPLQLVFIFFLFSTLAAQSTESTFSFLPCDTTCGVNPKSLVNLPKQLPPAPLKLLSKNEICDGLNYNRWKHFGITLLYSLGINDTFPCIEHGVGEPPEHFKRDRNLWEYLWRPDLQLSTYGKTLFKLGEQMKAEKVQPTNAVNAVNAVCAIRADRGIYRIRIDAVTKRKIKETSWIMRMPLETAERGSLFALINNKTGKAEELMMKSRIGDNCQNTSSCVPSKTFLFAERENRYSMFANFKLVNVPGVSGAITLLKEKESQVETVEEDTSWSNLAILCLPLLMSIPPISLLDSVSTGAVIAYVVATDILAAFPSLIKGIELLISSRDSSTSEAFANLSLPGKKSGVFERWYVRCESLRPQKVAIAFGLMGIALWFMLSSTLTEYLFWRSSRNRQKGVPMVRSVRDSHCQCCGSSKFIQDDSQQFLCAAIDMDAPVEDEEPSSNRATFGELLYEVFWEGRRKFIALLMIPLIVFYMCAISFQHFSLDCAAAHSLVVLYIFSTNRQFGVTTFLGFIFGFVSGPLYLFLHLFAWIRKSEEWEQIGEGSNIGAASLVMAGYIILTRNLKVRLPPCVPFAWVFGSSVVVLHILRCERKDRHLWEYGVLSFWLGMLFGPFGGLFMPIFKDADVDPRVKSTVYLGCAFGFICATTIITAFVLLLPGRLYS